MNEPIKKSRRRFIKHSIMGISATALGAYTLHDLVSNEIEGELRVGFRNDAPDTLWKWSKEADWYEKSGNMVRCQLCPHHCILGENDRGFCRTRVVKGNKLYTVAYGNPCSIHVDPIEKKPLYHFLPGTPILSIATAGCNLRCRNCQNWGISQKKPEKTSNTDAMPEALANFTAVKKIPSLAYTYTDPIIFYEYVTDTSLLAREKGIKNVLVTAGYIDEKPLRKLCRVTDGANVDLKAFNDAFYKKIAGARLAPVLRTLEIMREEKLWFELTRLVVPSLSDDMTDIKRMCQWIVNTLGKDTPTHFSRFHSDFKLKNLPPTPIGTMNKARDIAKEAGLEYVYVGNVPGHETQDTICPSCGTVVIKRDGYILIFNKLKDEKCPCGQKIPGVWA